MRTALVLDRWLGQIVAICGRSRQMPEISSFILSYEVLVPLFQAQPPRGRQGMLRISLGLVQSGMGHC